MAVKHTLRDLKCILLEERSQSAKALSGLIPALLWKRQDYGDDERIGACQRLRREEGDGEADHRRF